MADNKTEVIRYLRRKNSDGFTEPITYLGAEQRFVNALRNSSLNNLEEQYILGTDTYTESYLDDEGNEVVEKSYHINDGVHSITDYYKLVTTTYKEGRKNEDFFFEAEQVKLPDAYDEVLFGNGVDPYTDKEQIYCINTTTFTEDSNSLKIYPSSYTLIKTEDLYYVTQNGESSVHVLRKSVGRKYIDDGKREVIRESIANYLVSAN